MKKKYVSVIITLVLVAYLGVAFWVSSRGYSSATFAGSSFHADTTTDCSKVYSEFKSFLSSEGFRPTSSPSSSDSWAGIHSEGSRRDWYSKDDGKNRTVFLYADVDALNFLTSIKWSAHGFQNSHREAERRALQFALKADDWLAAVPELNILPETARKEKRRWFEEELHKLEEG
jgi:hypothetical protein